MKNMIKDFNKKTGLKPIILNKREEKLYIAGIDGEDSGMALKIESDNVRLYVDENLTRNFAISTKNNKIFLSSEKRFLYKKEKKDAAEQKKHFKRKKIEIEVSKQELSLFLKKVKKEKNVVQAMITELYNMIKEKK